MRQAQRKKEKDKVAIALMLAFCVIALTSIFTIKSNIDKINGSAQQNPLPVSEQARTQTPQSQAKAAQTTDEKDAADSPKTADTASAKV